MTSKRTPPAYTGGTLRQPVRFHKGEGDDCATFVLSFAPGEARTYVTASLHRGLRLHGSVLALFGGYLAVSREDLHGLRPRDCIALLCRQLWSNGLDPVAEA